MFNFIILFHCNLSNSLNDDQTNLSTHTCMHKSHICSKCTHFGVAPLAFCFSQDCMVTVKILRLWLVGQNSALPDNFDPSSTL